MPPIAIQELKHDLVEPDPRNPRQICGEEQLTELATDVSIRGVLQPIVVRPHPEKKGRFMIVFGERRWRAAGMVDLETVPCIVRQYDSELAVLEDQIAENGKRADVHPLEEADAYRRLHEEHGRDVDEIAELCGKSRAYVYAAMKLCALTAEPRRAFLSGKFDKSVALLIARLPEKQQPEATKAILTQGEWETYGAERQPMTYRQAQRYIREEFMLRLADAPFSVADAELVAKAGACTTCPKRTGNQRELFDDVVGDRDDGGDDICTDSTCYKAKVDVHWQRLAADAKAKGRQVLEGREADHAGAYGDKKHAKLDDTCYDDPKHRTFRELLGDRASDLVTTVARESDGTVKELVDRAKLPAVLKDAGVTLKRESNGGASYEKQIREKAELQRAVAKRVIAGVLEASKTAEPVMFWKIVVAGVIRTSWSDTVRDVCKARGVEHDGKGKSVRGDEEALLKYAEGLPMPEQATLALELLVTRGAFGTYRDADSVGETLEHAAELLGVDVKQIVAEARAEQKEKKAAKKQKAKDRAAAPKKQSNGVAVPAFEATS